MRTILTTAMLCALVVTAPRIASAQDAEDAEITKMAKMHYKLGLDAFKAANYPEAIKELKKAYLLKHLPPLLINIAKTYEKIGDQDNEIYYYKKYLAEAPPDAKDRDQIKQQLDDAIAAKSGAKAPEEAPVAPEVRTHKNPPPPEEAPEAPPPVAVKHPKNPPPEEAPPPAEPPHTAPVAAPPAVMPSEWSHTPLDAAPPGRPVDVRVQTPVMKGVKMWLYYRGKGQADFTTVEMKRRGQEKVARIPADMMNGKSIQYYIEAKDATGVVVKSSGSQADPNIVMVDASAPPQYATKDGSPAAQEPGDEPTVEAPAKEPDTLDEERPDFNKKPTKKHVDEAPPRDTGRRDNNDNKSISKSAWLRTRMMIIAMATAGFGVLALGAGTYFAIRANQLAQAVAIDSCSDPAHEACTQFLFNDPSASPNDLDFQNQGKLYSYLGVAFLVAGGLALATGAALIIVSAVKTFSSPEKPKPKKHKRRRRVIEEEEGGGDEVTPVPSHDDSAPETSMLKNFIVTPLAAPSTVGIGAGFSF